MTLLDWIVFAILTLSIFLGAVAVHGLKSIAGLTALPKMQVWQQAMSRAPLEQMSHKLYPWLPPDPAALIRY